jgi:MYXO-CTERM domain-containing protein
VTASTRRPAAPDWTDVNDSDAGVTVLQLLVFVALAMLFGFALHRRRTSRSGRWPAQSSGACRITSARGSIAGARG